MLNIITFLIDFFFAGDIYLNISVCFIVMHKSVTGKSVYHISCPRSGTSLPIMLHGCRIALLVNMMWTALLKFVSI